jgi:hypothetical protein
VAVPHVITVRHVAHYHADLALSPKKARPANKRGRIHGRIFLATWETGSEPGMSLEGAEAGPRPRIDNCPRATELGMTRDAPVHG